MKDVFLPYIENGWITVCHFIWIYTSSNGSQLIGATTENPSFKLNSALLSRCRYALVTRYKPVSCSCRVFVLERLGDADIEKILRKAIERVSPVPPHQESEPPREPASSQTLVGSSQPQETETETSMKPAPLKSSLRNISSEVMKTIINLSMGDARTALSLLELVLTTPAKSSDGTIIGHLRRSVSSRYDRSGEDRYDMISALHKSLRGSDGGAALYWLARYVAVQRASR